MSCQVTIVTRQVCPHISHNHHTADVNILKEETKYKADCEFKLRNGFGHPCVFILHHLHHNT